MKKMKILKFCAICAVLKPDRKFIPQHSSKKCTVAHVSTKVETDELQIQILRNSIKLVAELLRHMKSFFVFSLFHNTEYEIGIGIGIEIGEHELVIYSGHRVIPSCFHENRDK